MWICMPATSFCPHWPLSGSELCASELFSASPRLLPRSFSAPLLPRSSSSFCFSGRRLPPSNETTNSLLDLARSFAGSPAEAARLSAQVATVVRVRHCKCSSRFEAAAATSALARQKTSAPHPSATAAGLLHCAISPTSRLSSVFARPHFFAN